VRVFWVWVLLVAAAWAEPTRITFWHAFSGEREVKLKSLIQGFEKENPAIRVELRGFTDPRGVGNDYAELYRNLLRALDERKAPVVSLMYENWVTQVADLKLLVALDEQMGNTWRDMPDIFLRASTHRNGKRYSVPFNKSLWTLYANRKMLLGKEPPQNWTELRQRCDALSAQYPGGVLGAPSPFELFSVHFVSQGGQFFNPQGLPAFAGPVGISSAGYLKSMVSPQPMCVFGSQAVQQFVQGKLPYLIDTSAKLSRFESGLGDDLQVLPLPRGAGDRIQLTGTQLSLFAQSSPLERRCGLRLMRYLTAPEQTRQWAIATGYLPVRTSVYSDPVYIDYLQARPGRTVISGGLSRAQVQPRMVGWEATRIIINDALERMLYQSQTPQKELRGAQLTSGRLLRGLQGKH